MTEHNDFEIDLLVIAEKEKEKEPVTVPFMETMVRMEDVCKNTADVDPTFKKYVLGYHLINSSVIKETNWEGANEEIFSALGIEVYSKSDGSHLPGMDIKCALGGISNKSAKYSKNKEEFDISSYRLTKVCSDKNCGTPQECIDEIKKRKNFDYYSVIVRDEPENGETILYDWLLIPGKYIAVDPSSYVWEPKMGKTGKNKDTQVGWKTNEINGCSMSITFSMSSQLWIHLVMSDEIKKFIVATAEVSKKRRYTYIEIAHLLK
jgi:hypothetical protein